MKAKGHDVPKGKTKGSVASWVTLLLIVLSCVALPLEPAEGAELRRPVTVTRTLAVDDLSLDEIVLADLTDMGQEAGRALFEVKWARGGWFRTWSLRLESDLGLLTAGDTVELAAGGPEAGHTYEVVLSYAPDHGALSIRLDDLTAERTVYSTILAVKGYDGPVGSSVGAVEPVYLPVGVTWSVGSGPLANFIPQRRFDGSDGPIGIRFVVPDLAPQGVYEVWLAASGTEHHLTSFLPHPGTHWVELPMDRLPIGRFDVRVDYVEQGHVLLSDAVELARGRVDLRVTSVSVDSEQGTVSGLFEIRSDETMPPVEITVGATGVPLTWDAESQAYVAEGSPIPLALSPHKFTVGGGETQVPFTAALPGSDEYRILSLHFAATADPDVTLRIDGASHAARIGHEPELKVMSFNIRYPSSADGANVWVLRRDLAIRVIREAAPDVLGLQEPFVEQILDIDRSLEDYARISVRPDARLGDHIAIYYNKERLELLDWDAFWLSETPEVRYSASWGNSIARAVIWGRFRVRSSGKELYVFNTHFHHTADADAMRTRSAELLLDRIRLIADDQPVVVMGDFNTTPQSKAYAILTGSDLPRLYDARDAAAVASGPDGTTHGFTGNVDPRRIDWILLGGGMQVVEVEHILRREGDVYPSDHLPVVAGVDMLE